MKPIPTNQQPDLNNILITPKSSVSILYSGHELDSDLDNNDTNWTSPPLIKSKTNDCYFINVGDVMRLVLAIRGFGTSLFRSIFGCRWRLNVVNLSRTAAEL